MRTLRGLCFTNVCNVFSYLHSGDGVGFATEGVWTNFAKQGLELIMFIVHIINGIHLLREDKTTLFCSLGCGSYVIFHLFFI